jgi:hypothetical protein
MVVVYFKVKSRYIPGENENKSVRTARRRVAAEYESVESTGRPTQQYGSELERRRQKTFLVYF